MSHNYWNKLIINFDKTIYRSIELENGVVIERVKKVTIILMV